MSVHVRKQFFFLWLCALFTLSPLHANGTSFRRLGESKMDQILVPSPTVCVLSVSSAISSHLHVTQPVSLCTHRDSRSTTPSSRSPPVQSPAGRVAKLPKPIAEPNVTDSRSSGKSRDAGWPMLLTPPLFQ
ncbi:hypothetical protein V8C43DRAFT_61523 [Trichoderma afarasin]